MTDHQTPPGKLIVLVLAGSRSNIDPVARACSTSAKAFAGIGGRPMIEHVLATLISSGHFDPIRVSLPAGLPLADECPQLEKWLLSGAVLREDPAASPSASVLQVLEKIPAGCTLVVTTGDHPLLTPKMLGAFLRDFNASGAGAAAALTSADAIRARYPETRRTALRFRDGDFTGCNLFAFAGTAGMPVVRFWKQLEQHRKKPLKVARFLGVATLLRYRFRLLTLDDALARLGQKTGVKLQAIRLTDPHAGIDVDTPDDLKLVRSILGGGV